MFDSLRLNCVELAENPEARCPCVLLLDTSGSMQGTPIDALNKGLGAFKEDLMKSLASRRVEVAVVTFDSQVKVVHEFVCADTFEQPTLTAQGLTHLGTGINLALDIIQARTMYRANGVAYYRPWIFMITDGIAQKEPEQTIKQVKQRLKEDEANKRVAFFCVGVENANLNKLAEISVRTPLKLKGLNFTQMFLWLSASMSAVSHSRLDEQVALPPVGWGVVQ